MGDLREHSPVCDECGRRHPPLEYCYQYASHDPDPEWSARQLAKVTPPADPRPAGCRFRLQDKGKPYPRSSCNACGRGVATGLGRRCHHEFIAGVEPVSPKYGFSDEEQAALLQRPEIMADFLRYSQKHGFEKAVEHVRLAYMAPPPDPLAEKLRDMVAAFKDLARQTPGPDDVVKMLVKATLRIDESARRPVRLLKHEFHRLGAERWVILWGPSGYGAVKWRCQVGRLSPPEHKFAGRFVTFDGELFTDNGPDATHFSELP